MNINKITSYNNVYSNNIQTINNNKKRNNLSNSPKANININFKGHEMAKTIYASTVGPAWGFLGGLLQLPPIVFLSVLIPLVGVLPLMDYILPDGEEKIADDLDDLVSLNY